MRWVNVSLFLFGLGYLLARLQPHWQRRTYRKANDREWKRAGETARFQTSLGGRTEWRNSSGRLLFQDPLRAKDFTSPQKAANAARDAADNVPPLVVLGNMAIGIAAGLKLAFGRVGSALLFGLLPCLAGTAAAELDLARLDKDNPAGSPAGRSAIQRWIGLLVLVATIAAFFGILSRGHLRTGLSAVSASSLAAFFVLDAVRHAKNLREKRSLDHRLELASFMGQMFNEMKKRGRNG